MSELFDWDEPRNGLRGRIASKLLGPYHIYGEFDRQIGARTFSLMQLLGISCLDRDFYQNEPVELAAAKPKSLMTDSALPLSIELQTTRSTSALYPLFHEARAQVFRDDDVDKAVTIGLSKEEYLLATSEGTVSGRIIYSDRTSRFVHLLHFVESSFGAKGTDGMEEHLQYALGPAWSVLTEP